MCASTSDHLSNITAPQITNGSTPHLASTICTQFPSYFSNYAVLILIATSIVVQLTHVCKFVLMFIIAGRKVGYGIEASKHFIDTIQH